MIKDFGLLYKVYLLIICVLLSLTFSFSFASEIKDSHKKIFFMTSDSVEYNSAEDFIYAKGNIKIILDKYLLTANSLLYDMENDLLWAEGNVKIQDEKKQVIYGSSVFLKDKLKSGVIADFALKFSDNTLLAGKLAEKLSPQSAILHNTCFTPCNVVGGDKPIWQMSAERTFVDYDNQQIIYKNLFFEVYKVPVFYTPYFSHPTPSAKAKSGILRPEIKKSALKIPLYLRAKPNMDFTLTPKFAKTYNIFELEGRHKLESGNYTALISYGKTPYNVKYQDKTIKDTMLHRYHLFTSGDFHQGSYQYGFDLKRTSDKAYLKNYYEKHDTYLASKLYLNKVDDSDYVVIEGLHFQGLKAEDSKSTDPLILPKIRTKNIVSLNDEGTLNLTIENNSSIYQQNEKQLSRFTVGVSVMKQVITDDGHLLNTYLRNRGDLYISDDISNNKNDYSKKIRQIPEIQSIWRYPLIAGTMQHSSITVEPMVSVTIGRNFHSRDNKFAAVDAGRYELSESNLFLANRYAGTDYHEFGQRLSYGINSSMLSGKNYFNIFFGQLLHKHNILNTENKQNVGKFGVTIDNIELFYRFRKNKKFISIMDELGSNFYNDKLQLSLSFIKLNDLKKYYVTDSSSLSTNKIQQVHSEIGYQLTSSWSIGSEIQTDISTEKIKILYKSIRMTYQRDCVSMSVKLYDDYMADSSRGIKKIRSKTISIGLKVLNM